MEEDVEEDEGLIRLCDKDIDFHAKLMASGYGDQHSGEVSLREWLDRPKRSVDFLECFHIFWQVVEAVNLAHSQGIVVNNIRPSCFVMSTFNRVSFIESASCSSSSSDSSCEEGDSSGSDHAGDEPAAVVGISTEGDFELESGKELDMAIENGERRDFPLKNILSMEFTWYTSPEEAEGGQSAFSSDVYKLGVLFFELFCMFDTMEEKLAKMSNLRHRVLPPQMLLKWPKEASFCLWLLHPQPSNRPKMSELLQSELLNEKMDSFEEREAAIKWKDEIEEHDLLLDFLVQLQNRKLEAADKLRETLCFLCADIEEVENQRSFLTKSKCSFSGPEKYDHQPDHKYESSLASYETNEDSSSLGSRKRNWSVHGNCYEEKLKENLFDGPRLETKQETQEKIPLPSKGSRIMKNFRKLESAYFQSRSMAMKPVGKLVSQNLLVTKRSSGSPVKTDGTSANPLASKEESTGCRTGVWANPFLSGLCKYLAFSHFRVRAELKQGDLLNSSNLICSLAFDRDNEYFATAGVNRKIKIFEFDAIINENRDIHYPVIEMVSKAKLSNVCWNGYIKSQLASSDFEGVVQVWDVTRSEVLLEMREHEKRVWSVNYSIADPTKLASGSDDGTVKLWTINQAIVLLLLGSSTCTIRTRANVCSIQFPPDSAHLVAIGSADHNVYYYDLRNVRLPMCTMVGHAKTVSYVKFVSPSTIVSSSTDNSLKLWDLSNCTSRVLDKPIQTFTGHINVKNFVGLSISDGYIATGSETNEVYVYHEAFPMPVFSYKFDAIDPVSGLQAGDDSKFISCVCWRGQSPTLVAANSSGNIKVLEMV